MANWPDAVRGVRIHNEYQNTHPFAFNKNQEIFIAISPSSQKLGKKERGKEFFPPRAGSSPSSTEKSASGQKYQLFNAIKQQFQAPDTAELLSDILNSPRLDMLVSQFWP